MSRALWPLLGVSAAVAVLLAVGTPTSELEGMARDTRPNIVFVLTDDQDVASLGRMDKLQKHLADRGTTFRRSFVTTPLCCPSRATFLRGQYAHNHGVLSNETARGIPGGWQTFREGPEDSTLATWLDDAGYATAYAGKYMNGYGKDRETTEVPPGWDRWWGWQGNYAEYGDAEYRINVNGEIETFDRSEVHDTDYLAEKAEAFIGARREGPFFLVVAPNAPHLPAYAAPRHKGLFRDAEMPRPPSFDEADVSDKPRWARKLPRLGGGEVAEAERTWRQRLRSLQSVDDLVGRITGALRRSGQLGETYVVYASDNGYLLYRHRVESKAAPYEESIRVPLVIRGPGVPRGAIRDQLVANTDWAPTIAGWAGVRTPPFVDGRSLAPLLSKEEPEDWRERLLIEFYKKHPYRGVRTADGTSFISYLNGERELYDLKEDPRQLENAYDGADPLLVSNLERRLEALKDCSGAACRDAEG